ncbi:MAG: hypothetical protein KAW17_12125 [Candidatus Eisenbacteria sp.]|nr:hypothetical protein [Candidatus Eisenbacteria bacterium]
MHERNWVPHLLRLTGFVFFAVAVLGLVVFIWGSVSPGWYDALGQAIGLRPTGLALLFGGYSAGLCMMAHAEIIRLLRTIAGRS